MNDSPKIDTIVCAAKPEGFKNVFLKEDRWYKVRISRKMKNKIKYLAMYESYPISAIRYIGEVKTIKPYKNSDYSEIVLKGKAQKIKPITLSKENPYLAPRSIKYTRKKWIEEAKTLDDVFRSLNY